MLYKGVIDEINRVVISDPSYDEKVWCRYEQNNIAQGRNWKAQISVNDIEEKYDEFTIRGVGMELLLTSAALQNSCVLSDNSGGFTYPGALNLKEFTIGMDTACVAMGINESADEIKRSQEIWQPDCALRTLTDGEFGVGYEGSFRGQVHLVYFNGFLDEDTGYSKDDVVKYMSNVFKIKELELVKEPKTLESVADRSPDNSKGETKEGKNERPDKQNDLTLE